MALLQLTPWLHPSMKVPFPVDAGSMKVCMPGESLVVDLMDEFEMLFEKASLGVEGSSKAYDLEISVLWNTKDPKKALNPNEKISQHFQDGETFGVYGDVREVPDGKPKTEESKIPVTILTGFLGSGKTTLLNYILQEQHEKKIVIIENEFGEISIDDALLKTSKTHLAEKIVVMENGCMCCTIRGDLVKGLQEIVSDVRAGSAVDAIMIETTGMADPVPIVKTFMGRPELTQDLRLDAVVAMADAKHLPGRLDDQIEEGKVNEAYQQIAFADKIILNKLDLITTEQAISCKDRIREINKYAKVLPAVKGRIKLGEILDVRAHDMRRFAADDIDQEPTVAPELDGAPGRGGDDDDAHGGGHSHGEGHGGGHGHGEGHAHDEGHGHGEGQGGGHGPDEGHEGGHGEGRGEGLGEARSGHGVVRGHGHAAGHGQEGPAAKKSRHDARVNSFALVREGETYQKKLTTWFVSIGHLPPERGTIYRIKAILAVRDHPYKHVFHAVMDVSDEDDADKWAPGEKKVSKIVFIGKSLDRAFLTQGWEDLFQP